MQPFGLMQRRSDLDDDLDSQGAFARDMASGDGWKLLLDGVTITPMLARADTMLSRMRGLLGRGGLSPSEGLWITPCTSIHMFFMRFPIDAVFIDERMQVVRVVHEIKPWRMARGGKHAHSVLELPAGRAAFFNVRAGDKLHIVPN